MRGVTLGVVLVVRAVAVEHARACLGGAISPLLRSGKQAGHVRREVLLERREQSLFHDSAFLVPFGENITHGAHGTKEREGCVEVTVRAWGYASFVITV